MVSSLEEKVDKLFQQQQQIMQEVQNVSACVQNISYMLGLQTNIDAYQLSSTPGPLPQPTHNSSRRQLTPASACPPIPSQEAPTPGTCMWIHADAPSNGTPLSHTSTIGESKPMLLPASEVITKYPHLRGDCKMGELAAKLARESFFGKELMRQSTVMGFKDYPALPADGIQALKQTILTVCPEYQHNPCAFESLWRRCIDAINHACSKLRK